jgi:RNA polymerase sigma factor (sigma-70 family)
MHHDGIDSADDAVLLAQLNVGSKSAFDVLYNRHWELVYRSAYKRLNDAEKAQDVAQDVFVQLWIRGNKSLIENLPAYLLVSARNGVFKVMEKEARHIDIPVDSAPEIESLFDSADAGILHAEFLAAFHQLVEALPAQQRIIFKMRFEEELGSQQIADILEIAPKTVRNQLGKALSTLRKSLLMINTLLIAYYFR